MNLAQKILEHRKKLGLSQEELSEKLGVSRQSVSKWESDQAKPEVDKLIQMSRLFEITLDELITPVQAQAITSQLVVDSVETIPQVTPLAKSIKPKQIRHLWIAWGLTLALVIVVFMSQMSNMQNQYNVLAEQITGLSNSLSSTVITMNNSIQQFKDDFVFQNGQVADYTAYGTLYNYIDESTTYKVRILPKNPESTSGVLLNVVYSDQTSQTLETALAEDGYYTGYVTVSKSSGGASLSILMSTSSGKVNQVMGRLTGFNSPNIFVSAYPTLRKSDNLLFFPKGTFDLMFDNNCIGGREAFEGQYSFRIVRNSAISSLFTYNWMSNGPDNVCSGGTTSNIILIPLNETLNIDFKKGDVISLELVWVAGGKEKARVIQTYTRESSGAMTIATPGSTQY